MVIKFYRPITTATIITTKKTSLVTKLVKQGLDRYNKITLIDNTN